MSLTVLQEDEREALLLDRAAVIRVVSALRQYRALVESLVARASGSVIDVPSRSIREDVRVIEEGDPDL